MPDLRLDNLAKIYVVRRPSARFYLVWHRRNWFLDLPEIFPRDFFFRVFIFIFTAYAAMARIYTNEEYAVFVLI